MKTSSPGPIPVSLSSSLMLALFRVVRVFRGSVSPVTIFLSISPVGRYVEPINRLMPKADACTFFQRFSRLFGRGPQDSRQLALIFSRQPVPAVPPNEKILLRTSRLGLRPYFRSRSCLCRRVGIHDRSRFVHVNTRLYTLIGVCT